MAIRMGWCGILVIALLAATAHAESADDLVRQTSRDGFDLDRQLRQFQVDVASELETRRANAQTAGEKREVATALTQMRKGILPELLRADLGSKFDDLCKALTKLYQDAADSAKEAKLTSLAKTWQTKADAVTNLAPFTLVKPTPLAQWMNSGAIWRGQMTIQQRDGHGVDGRQWVSNVVVTVLQRNGNAFTANWKRDTENLTVSGTVNGDQFDLNTSVNGTYPRYHFVGMLTAKGIEAEFKDGSGGRGHLQSGVLSLENNPFEDEPGGGNKKQGNQ